MALQITHDTMTLEIDNRVVATARFSEHAAADGHGAWIVSTHPARPLPLTCETYVCFRQI
jgi:hypothetical protein